LEQALKNFPNHELLFVDDGSCDKTVDTIEQLSKSDNRVRLLVLSRNFGHQNALKAGLDYSEGDCVISLDADLQHPPSLIPELISKWRAGYEVVYTIRKNANHIPLLKHVTSKLFYKIAGKLSSIEMHPDAADFRLLDRAVIDVLKSCKENYLYIRGLVSWAGFRQTSLKYVAQSRHKGKTKYSFRNMIRFALAGITSFSIRPLQLSIIIGLLIAGLSFLYGLYVLYISIFTSQAVPGWASTTASILFIGGIQLIILGIIGEYLGKLFIENKRRPNYIVRKKIG
ncbi:MAG TPA: glycosyltransferase family 2 protein, partial [Bacteroidales bacterium]|nr:glycosyltransferase family 2 protein [Bacteroidales bacterium]